MAAIAGHYYCFDKYLNLLVEDLSGHWKEILGKHSNNQTDQRLVWPGSQSVTFDIVSRCFENKSNS